jgi:hypothetical protein
VIAHTTENDDTTRSRIMMQLLHEDLARARWRDQRSRNSRRAAGEQLAAAQRLERRAGSAARRAEAASRRARLALAALG